MSGEVTLPYTTSNFFVARNASAQAILSGAPTVSGRFPQPRRESPTGPRFAPANIKPGGIVDQSSGATAPRRLTDEVTLLRAIPASFSGGNKRPACFLSELLLLAKQARIELATSPAFTETLCQK